MNDPNASLAPPVRVTSVEDAMFWQAIDEDDFKLAQCRCGAYYARLQHCTRCTDDDASMRWVSVSRRGVVSSFVVFDKAYHPWFEARLPYALGVITLAEGPEIITNIIDIDVAAITIGMAIKIVIKDCGGQKLHQASARL